MIRTLEVLLLFLIVPVMTIAQSGQIRGMITDQETGELLIGATVLVVGTNKGAVTDFNGEYTILYLEAGLYEITASYIGYQTKSIKNVRVSADSTSVINFNLAFVSVILNQIEIITESLNEKIDNLIEKMEFGAIAFNAPTIINIDDTPQIQLILSLAETVDQLKQSITELGERVGANIKVSDVMEAHLAGSMFYIEAITPELQAVSKSQRTEWKWEITPKNIGEFNLYLTLTAHLVIDEDRTPRTVKTFEKIIEVKVTTMQEIGIFLRSHWEFLIATLLIPIGVFLVKKAIGWWKKKRKKKSKHKKNIIDKY